MISRRKVVQALGSLGLWPVLPAAAHCPESGPSARFCFEAAPFGLGVASGDPTAHSVVLWTRLATQPLDPAGRGGLDTAAIPVDWVVATDPGLREVVASGRARAEAALGYSVHVDVGGLQPGRHYWYRFTADGRSSRVGRTKTAPERASAVRLALVSCQDFAGLYGAFANLAREELDCVVHLGDTIYEAASDGIPAQDLPAYRNKHALFRADPLAREAWAAHPFLVTWDDHEVRDNYFGTDPRFDELRAAAYQAFYEHMPVRLPEGLPERWKDLRLYRSARFGDLLELPLLDLRQYRDPPPVEPAQAGAPGRTMLGSAQGRWLLERLGSSASWVCVGSPLLMAEFGANPDAWDGYASERNELLARIRDKAPGRVVVASGDTHCSLVARLHAPARRGGRGAPLAAIEFGTPALSSAPAAATQSARPDEGFASRPATPWVLYEDRGHRGFVLCEVRRDRWRSTYRVLRDGRSRCMTTLAAFDVARGSLEVTTSGFVPFAC